MTGRASLQFPQVHSVNNVLWVLFLNEGHIWKLINLQNNQTSNWRWKGTFGSFLGFICKKFRQWTVDQDSSRWPSFSLAFFSLMHADLEIFLCLSCDNRDSAYNTIHSHRPCCRRRPTNRSDVQVQTSHHAHFVSFSLAPFPWQFLHSVLINSSLC